MGPIGDDLPSLIPLVISLLIFFMVFSNTLTVYNQKNVDIRQQIDMTQIARIVKEDSLILSADKFEENCNKSKLNMSNYNYILSIYSVERFDELTNSSSDSLINDFVFNSQNYGSDFSDDILRDSEIDKPFLCHYRRAGSFAFSESQREYLIRFYPVAVQLKRDIGGVEYFIIEPAIMGMVIWR
jgi:hypothetical protein